MSRISTAVALQASEVLAADIRLGSPQPINKQYFEEAKRRGIATASNTALLSVVFNGDRSQLTNLRAVTDGYPLRGRVLIADEPFAPGQQAHGIPPPGEIWPDSKLLSALDAHVGSEVAIGAATLRVGHVLDIPSRPGRHIRGTGPVPADERGRPAGHPAHPAGQPRQLSRPVCRVSATRSMNSRPGSRRTRSEASGSTTSLTPVLKSGTPSIAPAAS